MSSRNWPGRRRRSPSRAASGEPPTCHRRSRPRSECPAPATGTLPRATRSASGCGSSAAGRRVLPVAGDVQQLLERGQRREELAAVAATVTRPSPSTSTIPSRQYASTTPAGSLRDRVAVVVARPLDVGSDRARRDLPVVARPVRAARSRNALARRLRGRSRCLRRSAAHSCRPTAGLWSQRRRIGWRDGSCPIVPVGTPASTSSQFVVAVVQVFEAAHRRAGSSSASSSISSTPVVHSEVEVGVAATRGHAHGRLLQRACRC